MSFIRFAAGLLFMIGLACGQSDSFINTFISTMPALDSLRWLPDGTLIYSDGYGIYRVRGNQKETLLANYVFVCPGAFCGGLPTVYHPRPLAVGDDGAIYIGNFELQTLQRYDEVSKTFVNIAANTGAPTSLAVAPDGSIYFNDPAGCRVRRFSGEGISTVAGTGICGYTNDGGLATEAQILSVRAIALDAFGQLYIADERAGVIRRVDKSGMIMTIAGTGVPAAGGEGTLANLTPLDGPAALAFDPQGNLLIAEAKSNRIRMVNADGIIRTIAGSSVSGHEGDEGPATSAQLTSPQCVGVRTTGELLICDSNRIRHLTPSAPGRWWFPAMSTTNSSINRYFAAGSWVTLLGQFPNAPTADWTGLVEPGGVLPEVLDGVSVQLDGRSCVIGYVSPRRIDLLLPAETIGPSPLARKLVVAIGSSRITTQINLKSVSPGFLSVSIDNRLYVAGLTRDGILISPQNPATPGQLVRLYLTGLNLEETVVPSSDLFQPHAMGIIGPFGLKILQARPAGPGIFELTLEIPANIPARDIPIVLVAAYSPPVGAAILSQTPVWLPIGQPREP